MLRKIIAIAIAVVIVFKVPYNTWLFSNFTLADILWYCNLAWLVLALGLYRQSPYLVSLILVSSVIQLSWYLELIIAMLGWEYDFNYAFFLAQDRDNLSMQLSQLLDFWVHALLMPSAIYLTYRLGFSANVLLGTLAFTSTLLGLSFILASIYPNIQVNCATIASNCQLFNQVQNPWWHLLFTWLFMCVLVLISFVFWSYWFTRIQHKSSI